MKPRIGFALTALVLTASLCTSTLALTIAGDKAQIRTIGGLRQGAWSLWSNGDYGDYLHFPKAGKCKVRVTAYGTPVDGGWPEMAFTVDGVTIGATTVDSPTPKEYIFEFDAQAKNYRIAVSFLNDALTKTEDRNLYVVSMEVGTAGAVEPTLTTEDAWRNEWTIAEAKREQDALAWAAKATEKNRKSDATLRIVDKDGHALAGVTVEVQLVRHEFLFGASIMMFDRFPTPKENDLYRERFRDLFNFATTRFYWKWYEKEKGNPDYASTDQVVAWCMANGITLKGHPLLWACEAGTPPWSNGQPPPEIRRQRVEDIMKRYIGKIEFWEVLNEPAHFPNLTIDEPYRWAREADPKAQLIVNDYAVMSSGFPPFFTLLEKAKRDGVPFDGIGIQAHEPTTERYSLAKVHSTLDHYATLGKDLYITEFERVSAGQEITGSHVRGKWDEAAQADYVVKFYRVCFAHPAVKGITWWDLSDRGAYLDGGGLVHADLSPKPAYTALKKLIHEEWTTKTAGSTDSSGKFSFRGFRGDYIARVTHGGKVTEQRFRVTANAKTIDLVAEK